MSHGMSTPTARRRVRRAVTCLGAALVLVASVTAPAAGAAPASTPGVSEEALSLASFSAMSPKGRAVYVANEPAVEDRSTFAGDCPNPETPDSYVLGCYVPGAGRIFLLRIERPELASGMAVTAAHEMLHAVHHQLSALQLAKLEPLLEWTYGATTDPQLHAEVDAYPSRARLDEIYARLGTEVAQLPPKLEHHYSAYFSDRSVVVAAAASYRHVFDDLDAQLAALDAQLGALEQSGNDLRAQLDAANAQAASLGAQIDSLRGQGRIAESNQLVDPANAAVSQANALVDAYNSVVAQHNDLVDHYNALAVTNRELLASLKPLPPN